MNKRFRQIGIIVVLVAVVLFLAVLTNRKNLATTTTAATPSAQPSVSLQQQDDQPGPMVVPAIPTPLVSPVIAGYVATYPAFDYRTTQAQYNKSVSRYVTPQFTAEYLGNHVQGGAYARSKLIVNAVTIVPQMVSVSLTETDAGIVAVVSYRLTIASHANPATNTMVTNHLQITQTASGWRVNEILSDTAS